MSKTAMNLDASIENATGLHYVNAPIHGAALVRQLLGYVDALHHSKEDDPLLFAYQCLDLLPQIATCVLSLEKWAYAIKDATPDQIQDNGAQLCHSTT